ncbi:FAD-dependent oxidoreductase [Legionella hackeliae]|uniref:FAD dependent oxidoreductase domain-containing protein n=1 Tax=Legionella hackeliae TaxID=449 RepID=A0A0A8UMR1_LEGHA|nr:FAD-dependent oxidoreductase [Legionella hackeliae]KTD10530.1 hypothetical protein Lhac_2898 [Legionella hackeliae]CEK10033.1 conserved protein of unknown function [Legionella hackeliae]STX46758.1 Protoporphyrinogen oxidase [Legionella hackeliae]
MKIAIIGAGWYGCHLALILKKAGYDVTLFEKNDQILSGISGTFGIRLHRGPHYLSSLLTRLCCQKDFDAFCKMYPEFIEQLTHSIYAHGLIDSSGNPSKASKEKFEAVCKETLSCQSLNIENTPYKGVDSVMDLDEPSIVIGDRLRELFSKRLKEAGVTVLCKSSIEDIKSLPEGTILIDRQGNSSEFDYTINATSYQQFIPKNIKENFPVDMDVVYQPCLGLKYRDRTPGDKPFSFIVMDGWFPCVMPCIEDNPFKHEYILTHGAFTIQASSNTPGEAYEVLNKITDAYIYDEVKKRSENEIERFWPEFIKRFEFIGVTKAVLAKIKTKTEFRSAVTFESGRIIQIIPGKISNVMSVGPEVEALIKGEQCLSENGIRFMKDGVLDLARTEIKTKPEPGEPNTCTLDTFAELTKTSFALPTQPAEPNTGNSSLEPQPLPTGSVESLTPNLNSNFHSSYSFFPPVNLPSDSQGELNTSLACCQ